MNKTKHTNIETIDVIKNFDQLPNSAFVRLPTLVALFSVSPATIWRWVKAGNFPRPNKLSIRASGWQVGDIRAILAMKRNINI